MQVAPRVLAIVLVDLLNRHAVGLVELLGQNDLDFGQEIAGRSVLRHDAVPFHAKFRAAGSSRRDAQRNGLLRRRHIDLGAGHRLAQRDGDAHVQMVSAAVEVRVRLHADCQQDVAGRATARGGLAMAADADLLAVLDARWNFHGQRLGLARGTFDGQLHLAAGDRSGKRDLDFLDQVLAALRSGGGRLAKLAGGAAKLAEEIADPARPLLAESLAEELAQIDVLGAELAWPGPWAAPAGRPTPRSPPGGSPPVPIVSNELP